MAIIALVLSVFLLFYAFWTLRVVLREAFPEAKPPLKPVPPELLLAAAIAGRDPADEASYVEALEMVASAVQRYASGEDPQKDDYPREHAWLLPSLGDEPLQLPSAIL